MKLIKTEDAVGHVLCHDITQIIRGVTKDAVFRKGHIITEEDIPVLLSVGKDNIYVWEKDENMLHEDEAAEILRAICQSENMHATAPKEGKIELIADMDGLLLIDLERLQAINALGDMMIATRPSGFMVHKGDKLCGTRVIPLVIAKERMAQAKKLAGSDDHKKITAAIKAMLDHGCEMVFCSGGMSVDPDDKTPLAIRNTGAKVVSYGAPVLPGAMFLVSYYPDGRPICGLPGCVMYAKRTIFDLVLPYLVTDTPITAAWLSRLGNGGLCLNCPQCHFPNCGFGKGV